MDKIYRALLDFGVPANLSGFNCLHDAIELALSDIRYKENFCNGLYADVARKNNLTAYQVERLIRYAIKSGFDRAGIEAVNRYFGNSINLKKGKATNTEFISAFVLQIGGSGQ